MDGFDKLDAVIIGKKKFFVVLGSGSKTKSLYFNISKDKAWIITSIFINILGNPDGNFLKNNRSYFIFRSFQVTWGKYVIQIPNNITVEFF